MLKPLPAIVTSLIGHLEKKGMGKKEAHDIAVTHLQKSGVLLPNSTNLSDRGVVRNNMSPSQRAVRK